MPTPAVAVASRIWGTVPTASTARRRMACTAVAIGGEPAIAAAANGLKHVGGVRSPVTPM